MNFYATYDENNILTGFHLTKPLDSNYVIVSESTRNELITLQFQGQIKFIDIESEQMATVDNVEIIDNDKVTIIDKNQILAQHVVTLSQQVTMLGHLLTRLMVKEALYKDE